MFRDGPAPLAPRPEPPVVEFSEDPWQLAAAIERLLVPPPHIDVSSVRRPLVPVEKFLDHFRTILVLVRGSAGLILPEICRIAYVFSASISVLLVHAPEGARHVPAALMHVCAAGTVPAANCCVRRRRGGGCGSENVHSVNRRADPLMFPIVYLAVGSGEVASSKRNRWREP